MSMQLAMSLAVGLAASLLGLVMHAQGHAQPQVADLSLAMLAGALLCAASALSFRRLGEAAGASVSGRARPSLADSACPKETAHG